MMKGMFFPLVNAKDSIHRSGIKYTNQTFRNRLFLRFALSVWQSFGQSPKGQQESNLDLLTIQ